MYNKRKSYSNISRDTAEYAGEYNFRFNEIFDGINYISDEVFFNELPTIEEVESITEFTFTETQKQFILDNQ